MVAKRVTPGDEENILTDEKEKWICSGSPADSRADGARSDEGSKVNRKAKVRKGASIKKNHLNIAELVRSLQRSEGSPDCFMRNESCEDQECVWRTYCLTHSPHQLP